jgi:hypothetical protein
MIRTHAKTIGLVVLAFVAGIAVNQYSVVKAQSTMVYELRTYTTAEGRLPNLLARFSGGEVSLFHRAGMNSVGYWVPDDPELSENTLVYMLAHESREAAAASWERFGENPEWAPMRAASVADGPIVIQGGVKSMFLNPTNFSPAR